jgi:hypothetical protein
MEIQPGGRILQDGGQNEIVVISTFYIPLKGESIFTMNTRIILLTVVLTCLIMAGCGSNNEKTPRPYTVWWSNPKGYNTNVLSVAQKETPFTIILPSYFPADVIPVADISGLAKSEFNSEVPVSIQYKRHRQDGDRTMVEPTIIIEEYSQIKDYLPDIDDIFLTFNDIQVLEMKNNAGLMNSKGMAFMVSSLIYSWNYKGIHYHVTTISYECDKARKIIESMVQAINQN